MERLHQLSSLIGKEQLVIDLSCRRQKNSWFVAMNKWQTVTSLEISKGELGILSVQWDQVHNLSAPLFPKGSKLINRLSNSGSKDSISDMSITWYVLLMHTKILLVSNWLPFLEILHKMSQFSSEFLVHAADVEVRVMFDNFRYQWFTWRIKERLTKNCPCWPLWVISILFLLMISSLNQILKSWELRSWSPN